MSSGGSQKAPSSQTVTQTNIPAELMPYATKVLGKAEALTSAPYLEYGGQRAAGFSPLQQQGYQGIQQMMPADQLNQATGFAGLGALRAAQGPQDFTGENVQSYMSPYMRNVVEQQQLGAIRNYQRELPGLASVATRVGGLGGTRQALLQSEAQRNLQDRLQVSKRLVPKPRMKTPSSSSTLSRLWVLTTCSSSLALLESSAIWVSDSTDKRWASMKPSSVQVKNSAASSSSIWILSVKPMQSGRTTRIRIWRLCLTLSVARR